MKGERAPAPREVAAPPESSGEELSDLLRAIAREEVPERLLDLATRLQFVLLNRDNSSK